VFPTGHSTQPQHDKDGHSTLPQPGKDGVLAELLAAASDDAANGGAGGCSKGSFVEA